ncbi:MAG: aminoacyl-histidine dipeptidase [Bacteroidales bacterium]|nr:aminoacyl-histidine dipeptidase [Bacteroidales bacterium]
MSELLNLEPKLVWKYFDEIRQVPRPSKHEEKIIDYLLKFGKKHNLPTKRDAIGNVLISKPGTKGLENRPTVVLQSHMDMVCEKLGSVEIDFLNDPIKAYVDGDWVKAEGTTLGADDGIGMAAQLALLAADNIEHVPLECLFTVDEETGLTGAFELEKDFISGNILLNLDSEDEGEIFIGCAGGIDTLAEFSYKLKHVRKEYKTYKIEISGLKGGHSGDEIHKGLGNSVKIIARFLYELNLLYPVKIAHIDAGNMRNAIPREASATVLIKPKYERLFLAEFKKFVADITNEIDRVEPKFDMSLAQSKPLDYHINSGTQKRLLRALMACHHGVINMSPAIEGLVETSTNLASVKMNETANIITVTTSQRSSVESGKHYVKEMISSVFRLAKAKVENTDGYPGWSPNPNSPVLEVAVDTYEQLFGEKPLVRAIHAGLECGLFLEKYPNLDMISFGPTLRDVHTPDERIEISTVEKWWRHLLLMLKEIK